MVRVTMACISCMRGKTVSGSGCGRAVAGAESDEDMPWTDTRYSYSIISSKYVAGEADAGQEDPGPRVKLSSVAGQIRVVKRCDSEPPFFTLTSTADRCTPPPPRPASATARMPLPRPAPPKNTSTPTPSARPTTPSSSTPLPPSATRAPSIRAR